MTEHVKACPRDFGRGWYAATDHICHFINALDSSEMTARDVRSAIYGECLQSRPEPSLNGNAELVERVAEALYASAQAENGNLSALPWGIVADGDTASRWRTYATAAIAALSTPRGDAK